MLDCRAGTGRQYDRRASKGYVVKEINWAELRIELIGWYKPMRMAIDGGINWRKQSLRILSGEVRSRELVSVGGGLN